MDNFGLFTTGAINFGRIGFGVENAKPNLRSLVPAQNHFSQSQEISQLPAFGHQFPIFGITDTSNMAEFQPPHVVSIAGGKIPPNILQRLLPGIF